MIDLVGMGGVVWLWGLSVLGWRLSLLHTVPGGLCWAGDLTMTNCKAFFSFPIFFCLYIDVQGHSFTYTTCIVSCSIFYICNVDGIYFKIQMRALCSLLLIQARS